jgi:hypothetical protein
MRGGHGWRLMEQWHVSVRELNRERSEPVTRSGERGPRQRGVSCTSPARERVKIKDNRTSRLMPWKRVWEIYSNGKN